ncbi:YbaK/EbsC family protein [Rhodovulum sulfidophilum]|uniref:YbaK/EbsC family protein n=1 Tax=Rhodovulum sulfidophilum TaxID=35806 RepID=UPI0005AADB94|nr:YbaK/EbsC family protein [Rhodovulum sulfidophilum]ANB34766.1 aminoacyl-tRNA deacylase [Rhodovulum sulfidophilum DSM 1374]ANB38589.1 aminoacyl-tRNA deacylase [Rhodovulum sulfidophilum]MBL3550822.1 YbaK/EbsC family protein [Rhodovulum sulfidophilum]MBL3584516.1 YbaK/EbsC family protein [Rhodovulum sulfidophilum]MBL3595417.1 YbaK/EbsC family protein [Rhodovulum sulfidophilum]
MSKSLKRVRAALEAAGITPDIRELGQTRTAQEAATAVGCDLDQIAKSIVFRGEQSNSAILFLTAGGNRVSDEKASALAGEPLGKADAALIRAQTGFAIGGVAPVGHLSPIRTFLDPRLLEFDTVWAAAGTPRHVFPLDAHALPGLTGAATADFTQ